MLTFLKEFSVFLLNQKKFWLMPVIVVMCGLVVTPMRTRNRPPGRWRRPASTIQIGHSVLPRYGVRRAVWRACPVARRCDRASVADDLDEQLLCTSGTHHGLVVQSGPEQQVTM